MKRLASTQHRRIRFGDDDDDRADALTWSNTHNVSLTRKKPRCRTIYTTVLSNMAAMRHGCPFKFKSVPMKQSKKFSSFVPLVTFHTRSSHMWLVATVWNIFISMESRIGQY